MNSITTKDRFPLPNIDAILSAIGKKQVFSSVDLQQGFHQVRVDPSSIEKTAFSTPSGQYEWMLLPFGLCNAPATFQRLTNKLTEGLQFCSVYLDDIIIYSETWQEHLVHLQILFKRLRDANLRMKAKKCEFACKQLLFLGHIVSSEGIEMDKDKIEAIQRVEFPDTVKRMQRFLGLAGYYRKFIPNYGRLTAPLYDKIVEATKTGKFAKLKPDEKSLKSFEDVKKAIATDVLLRYPDFHAAQNDEKRHFVMLTDASHQGLGAVLCQPDEELCLRPIYFASRRTKGGEVRYSATEIEGKGLHYACYKFYQFIAGCKVTVFTDHNALVYMFKS
ncbi:MAG TPA: reverse transcriptase family protein, partial [Puia sp.]|nr:reverse transcriptase family protein [Puia sp.]